MSKNVSGFPSSGDFPSCGVPFLDALCRKYGIRDVHTARACEMFGVSAHQVTAEQRRKAKLANFRLLYGIQ